MELAIQNRRSQGQAKSEQYENELKAEKEAKENAEREKAVKNQKIGLQKVPTKV